MEISYDEGFFFVTLLSDNKTEMRYRDRVVVKDNCTMEDIQAFGKEFDASPWIMYADPNKGKA
jgi:hypothetical protein